MEEFNDFRTRDGGKYRFKEIGEYLGYKSPSASIRYLYRKHKERFMAVYLGVLCLVNGIDASDIETIYRLKKIKGDTE